MKLGCPSKVKVTHEYFSQFCISETSWRILKYSVEYMTGRMYGLVCSIQGKVYMRSKAVTVPLTGHWTSQHHKGTFVGHIYIVSTLSYTTRWNLVLYMLNISFCLFILSFICWTLGTRIYKLYIHVLLYLTQTWSKVF